jgi:hypothetical protein
VHGSRQTTKAQYQEAYIEFFGVNRGAETRSRSRYSMEMIVRTQPVYYKVFALKDGTVYFVSLSRKPRKTKHGPRPEIDEEGICTWFIEKERPSDITDWAKGAWHTAVATTLSVKRIVRLQVQPRLDRIEGDVQALGEQMKRLENKIDQLLSRTT